MSAVTPARHALCRSLVAVALCAAVFATAHGCAQQPPASSTEAADAGASAESASASLTSPFRLAENWAQLPEDFVWGEAIAVEMDGDGNLYVFHRCSSDTCVDRTEPPLVKLSPSGELLMSWGEGLFVYPHGLDIDSEGNIWVTDARHEGGKGEVVVKFSPEGEVLMTIGTPGVSGDGPYAFDGVADVAVADDGSIFVADGHLNNRVVKYAPDGTFLMAWGQAGAGPGDFNQPHSIALDAQGRVFVADRNNNRVQIFDQDGTFIDAWTQFGRPSGLHVSANNTLYVADSQSTAEINPGFEMGIYFGSAIDGTVQGLIGDTLTESVAEAPDGNLFSGLVAGRGLQHFVRQ
jgi:sugar lactone lactonase YvrE